MNSRRPATATASDRPCRTPMFFLLAIVPLILVLSCSSERARPPDKKTAEEVPGLTDKALWADMLLRPTDSTRQQWITEMASWREPLVIALDSTGRGRAADLTFAIDLWIFKNLDRAADTAAGGLSMEVLIAATHVPDHLLMKDFLVDSIWMFLPGQDIPAARKTLFPARRKFAQGVWQVQFLPTGSPTTTVDFAEGTVLVPRLFVSWRGKRIVFAAPPVVYEYIQRPQPIHE